MLVNYFESAHEFYYPGFPPIHYNKPGPAQVGAISKAQKQQKDFQVSSILLQYSKNRKFFKKNFSKKLHTQKNEPSGAPGPASASPWRAKVSQCRKTVRGTLWDFPTSILTQNIKKLKGGNFYLRKKISQYRKTVRGTLWDFPTSILTQNSKKIEGGPFGEKNFEKKSRRAENIMKEGTLWSRPVWYVTRKNRKNLFGSVR